MDSNLERAIKSNELFLYLSGQKDYATICVLADMPTDPLIVLERVEKPFTDNLDFRSKFLSALTEMSKSKEYSWLTMYYILGLLKISKRTGKHYLDHQMLEVFSHYIKSNKEVLEMNFKWMGKEWPNGLWGDVLRMSTIIQQRFDLEIVPR